MRIGYLKLSNPTILAPLAGIGNLPFRLLAKEAGCALVCSEMVSANGLARRNSKTLRMLDSVAQEKPLSVQIFGADPDIMAEAARMVEGQGADVIDINFGCAVRKIVKTGAGVALMREPQKAAKLIAAVRRAVGIPMTVKMRSGWDRSGRSALELGRIAEACGVDAVALHPRSAAQGFAGHADWSLIGALKKEIELPVIGNGDIASADDARQMMETTGCDGVMIGRAAIGNPFIFSEVNARLLGKPLPPRDPARQHRIMRRYLAASVQYFGEKHACYLMRSRLGWFVKGLPHSSRFREAIKRVATRSEAEARIEAYFEMLQGEV